jgi:hypothetical protein
LIRTFRVFLWIAVLGLWAQQSFAGSLRYCDDTGEFDPAAQDRLIRIAAVVKNELDHSGQRLAVISRSGLALQLLDHRYSHAGVTLKASSNTPWSVRQLYYACDEKRPKIFDQGMAGFVMGSNDASRGFLSIVFLPQEAAAALERAALDDRQVLQFLGSAYSANAYAFSVLYQNCNQWLAELLASAWSDLPPDTQTRQAAQQWLQEEGYAPSVMNVGWRPLIWLASQLQWLHNDDHPAEDLEAARYRVSMPASIEAFLKQRYVQSARTEVCYTKEHVLIRRHGEDLDADCTPAIGDERISLKTHP